MFPIFRTLWQAFVWTDECARAFAGLKEYLSAPLILSQSLSGDPLYVYLAVSPTAVTFALVAEHPKTQQPIYYTNRALQDAELKYPRIQNLAFALVISTHKLRPYFQAYAIIVLTEHSLKQALLKLDTLG